MGNIRITTIICAVASLALSTSTLPRPYHLSYTLNPPAVNGFIRHTDKATGVPGWWNPITVDWTFQYPSKAKAG